MTIALVTLALTLVVAVLISFAPRLAAEGKLGALIAAVVMSQIVMLNFSYDVPVKLFSMHLLLQALVLAAPDAGPDRAQVLPATGATLVIGPTKLVGGSGAPASVTCR